MADPKTTSTKTSSAPADHDRVVMASRLADGTPAQTPDFEYIGDKDTAVKAAKHQLSEQAVSAVDVDRRGVTSDESGPSEPSGELKELKAAQDAAAKAAESKAEAEVNANHQGLGDK